MKKNNFIWFLVGIVGIIIFLLLYDYTFPSASIEMKIKKEEAVKMSIDFINEMGFTVGDFDRTIIFDSDEEAYAYLQYTCGLKKTNELVKEGIPVWFWSIRFFKELQKEGFIVKINPINKKIVSFYHFVLEDQPAPFLNREEAQKLSEARLLREGFFLKDYELKNIGIEKQKNRIDYKFEWGKKDYKIQDATLRISTEVFGNKLGKYKFYIKIPEKFFRKINGEISFGKMLANINSILKYLLIITIAIILFFKGKVYNSNCDIKFWFFCGGLFVFIELIHFFNRLPIFWYFYQETVSKLIFISSLFFNNLLDIFSGGLLIFSIGIMMQVYFPDFFKKVPLYASLKNKNVDLNNIFSILIVGYSVGFLFLGYVSLFYFFGKKIGIWVPSEAEYSYIFNTIFPFLFPFSIALTSAIREEFVFRLLLISFLKKYTRNNTIAIFLPSLLWGFAHTFYNIFPVYVRGIELTFYGILLGLVFLKYGLETVLLAHFVINSILGAIVLLRSDNLYFVFSGLVVIIIPFLPLLILILMKFKKNKL